ncbi:hypothetical protein FACS1894164_02660 [Spirochaetia bacterium]|nr:hypothetical protein FACS1894164_02660 [Spirochaetia bacterium]
MARNTVYEGKKLGSFEFNKFTYDTYYSIDKYRFDNYKISIIVYVETINELKKCVEYIYKIIEDIIELDKSARKIFLENLEAAEDDLNEIELSGIYYYKDEHFELIYDLPEEVGFEYVKAIFDNNNVAIDAICG